MKDFIEMQILNAVKKILTGQVNELLYRLSKLGITAAALLLSLR